MKRLIVAAVCALPLCSYAGFYDGNTLNLWIAASDRIADGRPSADDFQPGASLQGYVTGIYDSFEGFTFCAPPNATVGQMTAVVKKYIRERPAQWSRPANALVIDALKQAFPCAKK